VLSAGQPTPSPLRPLVRHAGPGRVHPYEGTTLPAYLFLVDDSGAARPTIIYNSGYDSTREESYFVIAAAALRRGYNVLAFDGPARAPCCASRNWSCVPTGKR